MRTIIMVCLLALSVAACAPATDFGLAATPSPSAGANPTSAASASARPRVSPTVASTPSAPATAATDVVARLDTRHELGIGALVSIHADGRVLSASGQADDILERWLTATGVGRVKDMVAGEPLLGASADYAPMLLPGREWPGRGGFIQSITVTNGAERVQVTFVPLADSERELFEPIPEIDRLVEIAALLEDLSWLPENAWLDAEPEPYVPEAYALGLQEAPYDCCHPAVAAADAPILSRFLAGPFEMSTFGIRLSCSVVDAVAGTRISSELAVTYGEARPSTLMVEAWIDDDAAGRTYHASLRALLPDEAGCDG